MAMHVAFYMHDLSGGGVERMRLTLIAALRARGLDVTLVLGAKRGPLLQLLPAKLNVVEIGAGRTCLAIPNLVSFLLKSSPDILVSSLDHNNIVAMLACCWPGTTTRLVICQHNALSGKFDVGWKYRVVPWAYWLLQRSADKFIAVSRGVADDLLEKACVSEQKIKVIYNPVIDEAFSNRADGAPPHPWLSKKDRQVFVFVGRLTAQKDAFTLLAAMELVLQHHSARLILLGEGEDEMALRRFVRKAGISYAVDFVGFQANPLPWIRHADGLISSSRYEGFGNVLVEALACGTPVIATDCPHGPSEILLQGRLGKLVPVGDAAALATAIANHDPSHFDAARLRARAETFSAKACAMAHLDLFDAILAGQRNAVRALGMRISPLRTDEVVHAVVGEIVKTGVHLLVTPNLDHVRRLRRPAFAAAYASARLVCPDGLPVLLYAQLRGLKLSGRVTGCDVFARLIRHEDVRRHRFFLVVESRVTALAASRWAAGLGLVDRIEIAVAPPGLDEDEVAQTALVRAISEAVPTILVMTLGAPVSEVFVHRHRHALPPCWALCVGQALRVELALTQRAPARWQASGLEWLWRLGHEPRRLLGRYARSLAWFPVAVWRDLSRHEGPQGG